MLNQSFAAPVKERILTLDIIRGFALFGILLVNTPTLNSPASMDTADFAFQKTLLDQRVVQFIFSFAMESFYPIFALLFGIGAAIFLSKDEKNMNVLFWRRMAFLFAIGLVDAAFVWWGDILIVYAVLGSLLPFFKKLDVSMLGKMILALCFTLVLLGTYKTLYGVGALARDWPDTEAIYAHGSFLSISAQRIHDYTQVFFLNGSPVGNLIYYLDMLTIMLLGMWVHKKLIFKDRDKNRPFFLKALLLSLTLLLSYNALADSGLKLGMLSPFRGLCAGIMYIAAIVLLCGTKFGFVFLRPLAYNGRMSLSSYLGFNIVLSLIFYGYGLGLYGSLGPAAQMPIVLGLYLCSVLLCAFWLKYFPFGPFEWVWRRFTYGIRQASLD